MPDQTLPIHVVETDHQLERAASKASEELSGKKARLALRYQQRLFEDLEESKDQSAG